MKQVRMSANELKAVRIRARLSQSEMARRMGFSHRGYQDLEEQRSSFAPRHLAVLERVSLTLAVEFRDIGLALDSVSRHAVQFSGLAGRQDDPAGEPRHDPEELALHSVVTAETLLQC